MGFFINSIYIIQGRDVFILVVIVFGGKDCILQTVEANIGNSVIVPQQTTVIQTGTAAVRWGLRRISTTELQRDTLPVRVSNVETIGTVRMEGRRVQRHEAQVTRSRGRHKRGGSGSSKNSSRTVGWTSFDNEGIEMRTRSGGIRIRLCGYIFLDFRSENEVFIPLIQGKLWTNLIRRHNHLIHLI